MHVASSVESIKGVGPKTAEKLRKAGLATIGDVIWCLPKRHEDFQGVVRIDDITPGKVSLEVRCESVSNRKVRRGMDITTAVFSDDTGKVRAVWFNQGYRVTQLKVGELYRLTGVYEFRYNRYQLTSPSVEKAVDMPVSGAGIVPVYRSRYDITTKDISALLTEIRPLFTALPETLPHELVVSEKLMTLADALENMHFPADRQAIERARERLAFEELFELLLASQCNKLAHAKLSGWHIPFDTTVAKSFVSALPFSLTQAQRRVAWDILQDFERNTPMNRLVQGDVGSGKTVVAAFACRMAAHAGFQSAIMAPTEILARQHAETLERVLSPQGVRVGLAVGSVKGKARKTLYDAIAQGEVDVVVGTHALIQDAVAFRRLGFAVIDEQHRFGVEQRQALLSKAEHMPHLLALTATPIPRSLALTVYGELDVSVIDERPSGRLPIITKIVSPITAESTYAAMDAEIEKGRQAYIICPRIEDTDASDKKSVEAEYRKLKSTIFRHRSIGLLHGRMKAEEKDDVMLRFKAGEYQILLSTTVVEVGVDVPNATVMLIENADQFGLSQLHQLRGRVGRGEHQSYCYLMMSDSKKPSRRLQEIEKSNDGFYLAEVDMSLRGPGEIYGKAQSGELNLQIATLADTALISRAQKAASVWVHRLDELETYPHLLKRIHEYQRITTLN